MEEGRVGFFQEALRGFMKCLGLESGGAKEAPPVEGEAANNPPPPQPPLIPTPTPPTAYEPPAPTVDDPSYTTADPLVEALTSSIEKPIVSTRDIDESNFSLVTIDEIMNSSGSGATTGEAHFVDLMDTGNTNIALLNTRLISSGGSGKNH